MRKEDYYALINHRGKISYYHIVASLIDDKDGYDTRLEYINYNPNRQWRGVWIKKGKEKIVKKFTHDSDVFKYFKSLDKKFDELILNEQIAYCKIWDIKDKDPKYVGLGTSYILKCWNKALKLTPNPLNIKI
jgi:hypothetical protein